MLGRLPLTSLQRVQEINLIDYPWQGVFVFLKVRLLPSPSARPTVSPWVGPTFCQQTFPLHNIDAWYPSTSFFELSLSPFCWHWTHSLLLLLLRRPLLLFHSSSLCLPLKHKQLLWEVIPSGDHLWHHNPPTLPWSCQSYCLRLFYCHQPDSPVYPHHSSWYFSKDAWPAVPLVSWTLPLDAHSGTSNSICLFQFVRIFVCKLNYPLQIPNLQLALQPLQSLYPETWEPHPDHNHVDPGDSALNISSFCLLLIIPTDRPLGWASSLSQGSLILLYLSPTLQTLTRV